MKEPSLMGCVLCLIHFEGYVMGFDKVKKKHNGFNGRMNLYESELGMGIA